jgi:hypothetical protein
LTTVDRLVKEKASDLGIGDNIFSASSNSLALIQNYFRAREDVPRVCPGFDATASQPDLRLELNGI